MIFTLTEELGKWAAENGHSIVYGGVNQGLMECVAKASKEAGGRTIGVVPMIVEKSGRISDYVDVEIPCDNLTDRKHRLAWGHWHFRRGVHSSRLSHYRLSPEAPHSL